MIPVKQPQRLFTRMKKAVLREDMMALTQDLAQAMVLGQMLYWTKTLDKVNDWLFEENKRLAEVELPQHEYNYGWIYKSAREMREDLMNAFSEDAIQRAFSALVTKGVLMKRNNPIVRYDRKLQYRVDIVFLRRLLKERGYEMTDFQLATIPQEAAFIPHGAESMTQCAGTITEIKTKIKNKELPLPPHGEAEDSAMASSSASDSDLISDSVNAANAGIGKANAFDSRPPHQSHSKGCAVRKKSPPKPVDLEFINSLKKLNPRIDVDAELTKMETWLLANPSRQKTRKFVSGWINRCAEKLPPIPKQETFDDIDWANVKPNQ